MSNPGKKIRIPLPQQKALELLLRVKPTAERPRQGAHPSKPKAKGKRPK